MWLGKAGKVSICVGETVRFPVLFSRSAGDVNIAINLKGKPLSSLAFYIVHIPLKMMYFSLSMER